MSTDAKLMLFGLVCGLVGFAGVFYVAWHAINEDAD